VEVLPLSRCGPTRDGLGAAARVVDGSGESEPSVGKRLRGVQGLDPGAVSMLLSSRGRPFSRKE